MTRNPIAPTPSPVVVDIAPRPARPGPAGAPPAPGPRGGWRIGRPFGIDLRLHVTFPLIVAFGAFQWGRDHGLAGAAFGALLMLALFACVALHELGHALAARRFGIPTREILLFPLGGVALLARPTRRPVEELLIAAAGPAVNVVLAIGLALLIGVPAAISQQAAALLRPDAAGPSLGTFLAWLLAANVGLVAFNLLPAFPMDGGRILRSLLAFRFGWLRGTRWAAGLGQTLAIAGGVYGVLGGNLLLALVAVFVWMGAGQERAHAESRHLLEGLRVADATPRGTVVLAPTDRLSRVAELLLASPQVDFPVLDGVRLLGVATRERLLAVAASRRDDPPVAEWLEPHVPLLAPAMSLAEAHERLAEAGASCGAVVDGGRLVGLVSRRDLAEATAVAAALGRARELDGVDGRRAA